MIVNIEQSELIAEILCCSLCSEPELLAAMNKHLSALLMANYEEDYLRKDDIVVIETFLAATADMVSEIVNGNRPARKSK